MITAQPFDRTLQQQTLRWSAVERYDATGVQENMVDELNWKLELIWMDLTKKITDNKKQKNKKQKTQQQQQSSCDQVRTLMLFSSYQILLWVSESSSRPGRSCLYKVIASSLHAEY